MKMLSYSVYLKKEGGYAIGVSSAMGMFVDIYTIQFTFSLVHSICQLNSVLTVDIHKRFLSLLFQISTTMSLSPHFQ